MFKLPLDRFSSHLSNEHPFLSDIIERALIILNHKKIQHDVLNELCSKVAQTGRSDCEDFQQFVQNGCSQLKLQVCVDKLDVPDALMQCQVFNYDEDKPCKIFVSQSWYKHILEVRLTDDEYGFHVVLGLIKLIHEVCHCCTSVFCAFSSKANNDKNQIKITPPSIGRKIVKTSPPHVKTSPSKRKYKHGIVKTSRAKKSTKEIGDMGFGGEELLLGGRLFPIVDDLNEDKFKIIGLRIDVHNQSSIASKKLTLDRDFINHLFDLDRLKSIDDFSCFKIPLGHSSDINQATEGSSLHIRPTRAKRRKLKRADSDSSPSSSSHASANSIDSDNLYNIDPNDPNVLYPAFYIPPPGFIPRSPNSIISTDDEDGEPCRVNGMPHNFRE